jgi:hypothetical protein
MALASVATASCVESAYLGIATPKDASFDVSCVGSCGLEGRDAGLLIEVAFNAGGERWTRQYAACCKERAALRARLQTIKDLWCAGIDVPPKRIGELIVGTTVSEATGKRGATIDDGEGYVAFNCGQWLDELIDKTGKSTCCEELDPSQRARR